MDDKHKAVKEIVKKNYAKSIGYSEEEIKSVPEGNLGLGCGNHTTLEEIKEGIAIIKM